ncbi:MAG: dienelactone hydrolase family protein [Pseudomonadota bacterium]|nr:dienelactone hydrolase family protein [Pseudomonadota bacterium]
MKSDIRARAIALYDRFTHAEADSDASASAMDRRAFFAELTKLAGSAAAANALLIGIAADPAAAAIVPAGDKRIRTRTLTWPTTGARRMTGYLAEPVRIRHKLASVVVIHENRGLNEHIRDVARRFAVAGFRALAPDFLSGTGGTPADADAARQAIGKLNLAEAVSDGVASLAMLKAMPRANGSVGAVGFCWGGAMVNRLAVTAGQELDAGVAFYGSAPDPAEAAKVEADMLLHFAQRDERVNKTGFPWAEALKAAGKKVDAIVYPGVEHAFHNDTSAERYNEAAARRAWARTVELLSRSLRAAGVPVA